MGQSFRNCVGLLLIAGLCVFSAPRMPDPIKIILRDNYLAYLAFHLRDGFAIKVSEDDERKEFDLQKPPYNTAAKKSIEEWGARDKDPLKLSPKYGKEAPKITQRHLVYYPLAWMETTDAFSSPGLTGSIAELLGITG